MSARNLGFRRDSGHFSQLYDDDIAHCTTVKTVELRSYLELCFTDQTTRFSRYGTGRVK